MVSPARNPLVPLRSTELCELLHIGICCYQIPFHHLPLGMRCSSSGIGATVAVEGYDRVSGADADPHENISHNGSSGCGGNADSAETADLRPCTHPNALTTCIAGLISTICITALISRVVWYGGSCTSIHLRVRQEFPYGEQ
jgi:hypothetical protein